LGATPFGFGLGPYGSWRPVGVNTGMRICRYFAATGDGFAQHFDAQFCPSQLRRSIFSILIYLTDASTGGDTVFYHHDRECFGDPEPQSLEGYMVERVSPKIGRAVLFPHDTLHAGLQPQVGMKMLIRTDLIYIPTVETLYPMTAWPVFEQESFLKALSKFREAQNLESNSPDADSLEKASALYAESLMIRRAFGPEGRHAYVSGVTNAQDTDAARIVQQIHDSHTSRPSRFGHHNTTKEIMRRLSPIDQDNFAQTCKMNRDCTSKVRPYLHAPWLPQLLHREGLICIMSFGESAFEAAKEACLRVAAMEAIAQFGHRLGSPWFISEWDPSRKRVLTVPKSVLLGAAYYELPCEGVFLHLERDARIDQVVNNGVLDDEEVDSNTSHDEQDRHFHGVPLTSDRIRIQELASDRLLMQVDRQLVKAWFERQGGLDAAEKCFSTLDATERSELPHHELAEDTAKGLPILQDWVNNGGDFEGDDRLHAYCQEGLEQLKLCLPSLTVLQSVKALVNFGPYCSHHGDRPELTPPRYDSAPVAKSLLINNLIFDFRSTVLKVLPLEDVEDTLSDLEKQLISREAPYAAAYVAEIKRKHFNHASCQCGDYDDDDQDMFQRLQMGPSFLLHRVVLIVNCQSESWRCQGDGVCIKTIYGGIVAL